ncbi:MAG: glutaminase [Rhodothermales bacterium]|nr:glutaminase [Rhodothermales bacterium]MBO6779552.1 glutaminase [Rhodothermales bacterium]
MVDYGGILQEVLEDVAPSRGQGESADYIPPLADVDPARFGMAVRLADGTEFCVGEADEPLSIQSVSKVFRLAAAMERHGDALWDRVGREPSGTSFNSLIQIETEQGVPRNPMINAGALVVLDAILDDPHEDPGIAFLSRCLDGDAVGYDAVVAEAERVTAHRNRALAHLLKSFGNLRGDPDAVVDAHCRESAVTLSCRQLCRAGAFLARDGVTAAGHRVLPDRQTKRLCAVMITCGVYDEAGEYAYRVGLPAKSGVGGGVLAVLPDVLTVCVWSPGLNAKGNSLAGTRALETFTTLTGHSVF